MKLPKCPFGDCQKPQKTRGYCKTHYYAQRRAGVISTVNRRKGEGLAFLQDVVFRLETDECFFWSKRSEKSYPHIDIGGRSMLVHRMVCENRYGPAPEGRPFAAHNCGNGHKGCVNYRHLRWASPAENTADRKTHGTMVFGTGHHSAKLDEHKVREIKRLATDTKHADIAKIFGVHKSTIQAVTSGRYWAHVT